MSEAVSRRRVVKAAGVAGVAAFLAPGARAQAPGLAAEAPVSAERQFHEQPVAPLNFFFNDAEAAFVRAAVDQLIPPDERWPGAAEAGVVEYIDRQLAGAYGNGARMYLQGPWAQGTPQQGYQLPYSPAQLYRAAIQRVGEHLEEEFGGRRFDQLEPEQQRGLLEALEAGDVDLGDVPAPVFFETLLANTIEGFFADPAYGGNRGMVGWRMIGFPGAFAQFAMLVERHGVAYEQRPMSMAEAHLHHDHGH